MTVAEQLDLSRLPAPWLIDVDYEADLAARIAFLLPLFDAAGIPYDVHRLQYDTAIILEQVDNNRETLVKAAYNDGYKSTLIAFARGGSLDHFAANFHSLVRMPGEEDERFRRRIQLEADNKSGGRLSGYVAECMKASIEVADVGAWVDRSDLLQPCVRLAIMIAAGKGVPSAELVLAVQAHIDRKDVKQATDIVHVQPVEIVETEVDVTLYHRPGPDPAVLRTGAKVALEALLKDRHSPGRDLPVSSLIAAASVGGVERVVVNSPDADVIAGFGKLIDVVTLEVRSAYVDR